MNGKKNYNELELKDDFMFGKVMANKTLCKKVLETLLETSISDISYSEREKFIQITKDKRSIRLDVYVRDDQDKVYDADYPDFRVIPINHVYSIFWGLFTQIYRNNF